MVSQLYQLRYEIQKLEPNNRFITGHTLRNRSAKNWEFVHAIFFIIFSHQNFVRSL